MTRNFEIDTDLLRAYSHIGVPSRHNKREKFPLKSVLQDIIVSNTKVISKNAQVDKYDMAVRDDPGWFMVIQSPSFLDTAKHVAVNIVDAYVKDGLKVSWITSFLKDPPQGKSLYVLDALFSDDLASRRSRVYEILMGLNNPSSSVILLCRSPSMSDAVHQIGIQPHMTISLTR